MESSNAKVLEELKLLNNKFDKLEAEVAIARNVNLLLSPCLVETGRQSRETIEIMESSKSLTNDEAATKVCQIFRSLDFTVNKEDLDAYHWLKDKEKVIVKFCQRKDLNTANLDLLDGSKIVVNQILCLYYRLLWSTRQKLHGKGRIFGWYVSNRSIKIKLQEKSQPLYISYKEDFKNYFPDVNFHSL